MTQRKPSTTVDVQFQIDVARWRKLFALATEDRREPDPYALIVLEKHIDRQWPRLQRRKADAELSQDGCDAAGKANRLSLSAS